VHDEAGTWQNTSYTFDAYGADKMNMNEEWWGIVSLDAKKSEKGLNARAPKQSYNVLRSLWASSSAGKRHYVRMNTVFPVEFQILNENGEKAVSSLMQGFTRDVSPAGLCIEFKSITLETEKELLIPSGCLALTINPPFSRHPIKAISRIVWLKKEDDLLPARYLIGVAYTEIDAKARNRIIKYARRLQWIPRLAAAAGLVMLVIIAGLFVHNQELLEQNRHLVNQLVDSAGKKSDIAARLDGLLKRKEELNHALTIARGKIGTLETSIASLTAENVSQKKFYEQELSNNFANQKKISEELARIQEGRKKLEDNYKDLKETERPTASLELRQMYGWLRSHQNLHTGLVASFEGDPALEDWAFTYDQSLVCQAFLLFGDTKNAAAILSFYEKRAARDEGAFLMLIALLTEALQKYGAGGSERLVGNCGASLRT